MVNEENIKRISNEYKGSDKEKQDLLDAYTRYKGRLGPIYESVLLSDILEDDDRFRGIIDEAISLGTVESYDAYERENNDTSRQKAKDAERKRREAWDQRQAEQEAATTDASGKPNKKPRAKKSNSSAGGMADLAALIQQRQKARQGGFFDHLEAKYAPESGRGAKRASPMDEPSEEAFAAMAARKKTKTNGRAKKAKNEDEDDVDVGEESIELSEEEAPKKKKGRKVRRGRAKA